MRPVLGGDGGHERRGWHGISLLERRWGRHRIEIGWVGVGVHRVVMDRVLGGRRDRTWKVRALGMGEHARRAIAACGEIPAGNQAGNFRWREIRDKPALGVLVVRGVWWGVGIVRNGAFGKRRNGHAGIVRVRARRR